MVDILQALIDIQGIGCLDYLVREDIVRALSKFSLTTCQNFSMCHSLLEGDEDNIVSLMIKVMAISWYITI